MPNYNQDLQSNNSKLDNILQTIRNLPEAGQTKPEVAGAGKIVKNGKQTFNPPAGSVFSSFTADVQVPVSEVPKTQEKEITITKNGDYPITPDVGKVLSKVLAHVNVSGGGGGFDPTPLSKIDVLSWTFNSSAGYLDIPPDKLKGLTCLFFFNLSRYAQEIRNDIINYGVTGEEKSGYKSFTSFAWGQSEYKSIKNEPYGLNMSSGRLTFTYRYDVYPAAGDTYVGVLFYK